MEVLAEAERLEVKDKAALVLVELLMDEKVVTQIKQHRKLLLRVSHLKYGSTHKIMIPNTHVI